MTIQAYCAGPFSGGILSLIAAHCGPSGTPDLLHLHISSNLIGRDTTRGLLFSFGATRLCRNLNLNPLDLRWLLCFLVNTHPDSELLNRRNELDLAEEEYRKQQSLNDHPGTLCGSIQWRNLVLDFGPLWSFRNARPLHLHISSNLIGRDTTRGLLFSFGAIRLCRNLNLNPLDLRWLLCFLVNIHTDSELLNQRNELDLAEDPQERYSKGNGNNLPFLALFLRKAHLESHFLGYSQTSVRIPSAQGGNEELLSSFTTLSDTSRKGFIAPLRMHEDRWICIGYES
ncbi:hypothetical protein CDAR_592441 [Caerostris darwini]|uniref:Uncharacterized protein n=1 Tax=Caerostris darwini TaxID=1538125 RepID=A0AAV4V6U7_9ARAC|nr:hypothetical protein CDAR_592441 [Caerostris darwini]